MSLGFQFMRICVALALLAVAALSAGCAARRGGRAEYRYVSQNGTHVLVPPGVRDAGVSVRTFLFPTHAAAGSDCRIAEGAVRLRRVRGGLRVTVDRAQLQHQGNGRMAAWSGSLEQRGCLAAGESGAFARAVAESVPLEPGVADSLLHADPRRSPYVNIEAGMRLRIVSPILRQGAAASASAIASVSAGDGNAIEVAAKASPDFLGFESAWVAVQPRPGGMGVRFVPLSAERRIGDSVTSAAGPAVDHLRFAPEAAWFRMFFLTPISQADHDIAVVGARSRAELDERTPSFERDPESCSRELAQMCALIPREVAVTPYLAIRLNGKDATAAIGGTVGHAIDEAGGEGTGRRVLPSLTILRPYAGRLVPVRFDRDSPAILDMPLMGGEEIRW